MSKKMIGIEIGADTLKLAQVKNGRILTMAAERMPDHLVSEGRVTAPATMSKFIKDALKATGIKGRECAFVLPPQMVVSQRLTVPVMSANELKLNLPYEFKDYVGRNTDDYTFDYIVTDVHDNAMELYAAAVRTEYVEEYYEIFRKAGLTMKIAMPAEMAWLNVINNAKNCPESLCIIDIGHEKTRINIYNNRQFVMGKDIEYAGQLFDEAIAMELQTDSFVARNRKETNHNDVQTLEILKQPYGAVAMEVMKTMTFYSYADGLEKEPVKDMYLCGGSANIELLRNAIVNATDMVPHHISKLLKVDDDQAALAMRCGLAAGAAMQNEKEA